MSLLKEQSYLNDVPSNKAYNDSFAAEEWNLYWKSNEVNAYFETIDA